MCFKSSSGAQKKLVQWDKQMVFFNLCKPDSHHKAFIQTDVHFQSPYDHLLFKHQLQVLVFSLFCFFFNFR